jgi:hypothetical protein
MAHLLKTVRCRFGLASAGGRTRCVGAELALAFEIWAAWLGKFVSDALDLVQDDRDG